MIRIRKRNQVNSFHIVIIYCVIASLVFENCSKTNDRSNAEDKNLSEILSLGFKLALKEKMLTDVEKTQDPLGRYLIYIKSDSDLVKEVQHLPEYHFKFLDSNDICGLARGQNYLILNIDSIESNKPVFRIQSDCVYNSKDTCITHMWCGGELTLKMDKKEHSWIVTDTLGSSN